MYDLNLKVLMIYSEEQQPQLLHEEFLKLGISAFRINQNRRYVNHHINESKNKHDNRSFVQNRIDEIKYLEKAFETKANIFHFWNDTFFSSSKHKFFYGTDLAFIKARNKRIILNCSHIYLNYQNRSFLSSIKNQFKKSHNHFSPYNYRREYFEFLNDYVDLFVCSNPYLKLLIPDAKIIPSCIDVNKYKFNNAKKTALPKIVHYSPKINNRGSLCVKKTIYELFSKGLKFEFYTVSNLNKIEHLQLCKEADICIGQFSNGWYDNFSISCMGLGKPVINYLNVNLINHNKIPIVNANAKTLKKVLRELLSDYRQRVEIGKISRQFVEENHNVNKIAIETLNIYKDILLKPQKIPEKLSDVSYLSVYFKDRNMLNRKFECHLFIKKFKKLIQNYKEALNSLKYFLIKIKKSFLYRGLFHSIGHFFKKLFYKK